MKGHIMKILKGLLTTAIIATLFALPNLLAEAIPADVAWIIFDIFAVAVVAGIAFIGTWLIREWESK